MSFDGAAFGREITSIIKAHIDRKTAELQRHIDWLERRIDRLEQLEPTKAVKLTTPKAVVRLPGPTRVNGKDAQ